VPLAIDKGNIQKDVGFMDKVFLLIYFEDTVLYYPLEQ
jgi:hypothetical protein